MYCEFYGLKEKPFTITPNSRFVFLSKNHREAFAHLLYGIDNRVGFVEFIGEVGTGKTTVLRTLLSQLDDDRHRTALIFNPFLTAEELLVLINKEFGLPHTGLTNVELIEHLNRFLLRENADGRTVTLVLDEAQNLAPQVMEQVRLISNLETETEKLIQIVLAGQPELEEVLNRPNLRQLRQRISVRYHLRPMDYDDTCTYVRHRLEVADGTGKVSFTPAALRLLYTSSQGTPRLINVICDRALLVGYGEGERQISVAMMATAVREIRGEVSRRPWRQPLAIGLGCLALVAVAGGYAVTRQSGSSTISGKASITASGSASTLLQQVDRQSAEENRATTLNLILSLWGETKPVAPAQVPRSEDLERAVTEHGLQMTRFAGTLDQMVRLGVPALVPVTVAGQAGTRTVALVGTDHDRLIFKYADQRTQALGRVDAAALWPGYAFIVWKNSLRLPPRLSPGVRGDEVRTVQRVLKRAGFYQGRETGLFDRRTQDALRGFQAARGIAADGLLGEQTILLLNLSAGDKSVPRFDQQGGAATP